MGRHLEPLPLCKCGKPVSHYWNKRGYHIINETCGNTDCVKESRARKKARSGSKIFVGKVPDKLESLGKRALFNQKEGLCWRCNNKRKAVNSGSILCKRHSLLTRSISSIVHYKRMGELFSISRQVKQFKQDRKDKSIQRLKELGILESDKHKQATE